MRIAARELPPRLLSSTTNGPSLGCGGCASRRFSNSAAIASVIFPSRRIRFGLTGAWGMVKLALFSSIENACGVYSQATSSAQRVRVCVLDAFLVCIAALFHAAVCLRVIRFECTEFQRFVSFFNNESIPRFDSLRSVECALRKT